MKCQKGCTRRQFITEGTQSILALSLSGSVESLLSACGQQPATDGTSSTPATKSATDSSNVATFSFTDHPELQSAGGSLHASIQATSGTKNVYITRVSSTSAVTVSTVCTHQGCTIGTYNSSSQKYTCPCHGSIFGSDGSVIQGPASSSLTTYATTITATGIQVTVP